MNAYTIVQAMSMPELEKRVNEYIQDGWVPIGGITMDNGLYMQAMTLRGDYDNAD